MAALQSNGQMHGDELSRRRIAGRFPAVSDRDFNRTNNLVRCTGKEPNQTRSQGVE